MQIFNKTTLITVAGFASIFIAIAVNGALSAKQQQKPPIKAPIQYPIVSVAQVQPISEQAKVYAFGEVTSRNQLELTSQVSGKLIYLSPTFLTGNTFKRGEVLAQIEPIVYQEALAVAHATLADAKLALAQEQLNSEQAAQEWQHSGLAAEQASDLVLRKPQLAVAKANHVLAQKQVEKAEYDLAQTKIVAPFDALIVAKQVQVGSNIQSGSIVASLYDIALFEVVLPLSTQQWQLLAIKHNDPQQLKDIDILLTDETGQHQWPAIIDRFEQHIDGQSRQRAIIATVKDPIAQASPLFPGTFVKANIEGQALSKLWKLPASALIDNDKVWQVSEDGLLSYLPVSLAFSQDNDIYVEPLTAQTQARIVKRPLASYLVNMKVEAVVENKQTLVLNSNASQESE